MTDTETDWQFPIEDVVARHRERIDPDLPVQPFTVEAWFTGDVAATLMIWVGGSDKIEPRDAMLNAADILIGVCQPDYLVLCYDTHISTSMTNPKTGQAWGPHEMQNLCDSEGFCDTGQIRDNLVVTIARRSDDKQYMHGVPYHVVDRKVHYFPEPSVIDGWSGDGKSFTGGIIPDALREAYAAKPITEQLADQLGIKVEDFDLTPDQERMHKVMAAVRILGIQSVVMGEPELYVPMVVAQSPEQEEILRVSAERSGMEFHRAGEKS